jgi:hypothetical protein
MFPPDPKPLLLSLAAARRLRIISRHDQQLFFDASMLERPTKVRRGAGGPG